MREVNLCTVCGWHQPYTCVCEKNRSEIADAIRAEDSKPELDSPFVGIAPTFMSVDHEIIRSAVSAIDSGIEYAQEVLARHEANNTDGHGRMLARHKREAQRIEEDIKRLHENRSALRKSLGWPEV